MKKLSILSTDPNTTQSASTLEHNYAVSVVSNDSSLSALLNSKSDALIIDEQNPFSLSTVDITTIIRSKDPEVVIIALNNSPLISNKVAALRNGADHCLTKPLNSIEITAHLETTFRRLRGDFLIGAAGRISFNDIVIEENGSYCAIKGKEIKLTTHEYLALTYLVKERGKPVSREFLTNKIWNLDAEDHVRPMDNIVGRLRKKLRDNNSSTVIATVWGRGYRVEVES